MSERNRKKRRPGPFARLGHWFAGLWAMLRNFDRLTPAQRRRTVLLCALPLLAAAGALTAAVLLVQVPRQMEQQSASASTYVQQERAQEIARFSDVILPQTADAGDEYLQQTLFVGDSNTVRLAGFGEIEMNSMAGVVGMGVQSVPDSACIWFAEYGSPVTMAKAAALLQPRRMIVMFGTNNTDMDTAEFIAAYEDALDALADGYPAADLIIAAVPPVGKNKTDAAAVQKKIDAFNLALAGLAQKRGLRFLDGTEVLQGSNGYMKPEYVEKDGMHFTAAGAAAYAQYVRTHSYITADDRPTLKKQPTRIDPPYTPDSSDTTSQAEAMAAPTATPEPTATPGPSAAPTATPQPTATPTATPDTASSAASSAAASSAAAPAAGDAAASPEAAAASQTQNAASAAPQTEPQG